MRALAKTAPLGLIQFDSHTDLFDSYFGGQKFTHGTPFRRAIEEGLVDPTRFVQVGIRGTAYNLEDVNGVLRKAFGSFGLKNYSKEEFRM